MPTKRELLDEATRAHYREPSYYDHVYGRRRMDVAFYAEIAGLSGGDVLELGVGTGRVAIAIARGGQHVTGVEAMPEMLAGARAHLCRLPAAVAQRVRLRKGDLRSVRLRARFDLVIAPFNVFMHLYSRRDVERALATVRHHLRRGGHLVFDVLNPDPAVLTRDPQRTYRCRPILRPPSRKRFGYREAFEYDGVTQIQTIHMLFEDPDDTAHVDHIPLAHRQFFPAELEALLHYNGFRIIERYGDFAFGPLRSDSDSQVIVARPVGRGPGPGSGVGKG